MTKDIWKYIANCTLYHREKVKVQSYPLQMTAILEIPFDKIAIDLVMECETLSSSNRCILTIIDHLTACPEALLILDKYHSIYFYQPLPTSTPVPRYI